MAEGGYDIPMEGEELEGQQQEDGGQQQEPGDTGQQQGVIPVQEQWDGSKFNLIYRGQPYIPKSKDELINLAQKGFSYTQELEKFNKQRREYDQRFNDMQSRYKQYDEFDSMLKNNPAFAERMVALAQEFQGVQQGQGGQPTGGINYHMYNGVVDRLNKMEELLNNSQNSEYDRKLSSDIDALKAKYPNHQWDYDDGTGSLVTKILQFAYDNGITNIDHAYRVMMWDQMGANAKGDALKKAAEAKQAANRAGIMNGGRGAAPPQNRAGYKYGASYNDLVAQMAHEMK